MCANLFQIGKVPIISNASIVQCKRLKGGELIMLDRFPIRLTKEIKISIILFLLPLTISILALIPSQYQFQMKGDIVPVEELGVSSSVHFTYVRYGETISMFEKWFLEVSEEDITFTPKYDIDGRYSGEGEDHVQLTKNQVITYAVSVTSEEPVHISNHLQKRVSEIKYLSSAYEGNSLGLMLAVGLIEEMKNVDYSQNNLYKIAGTGTIQKDHQVGSVGSIRFKLLTAEENGVDIFFVPKDREVYGEFSNQVEASRLIKEQDLSLQIIPVSTLEEAINYLESIQ